MTEYEKKIEELRGICEWLREHRDEVDRQAGAVLIAFENPGTSPHHTASLSASGHFVKLAALHLALIDCMEKNAGEDEPKDGKVIALQ